MKNSSQYAPGIKKLYRLLKKQRAKVEAPVYEDPVDALVSALVSEKMTRSQADSAMKRFDDYFVDLNDLRVSRPEEVIDLLGKNLPGSKETAVALAKTLGMVFEKYNCVSLKALRKMGKKPARQVLDKMEGITRFAVNYCVLAALGGHSMPLTETMVDYLKAKEMVHPDTDLQQIEGFLGRQISARNSYEFYMLLRNESETKMARKRKKTKKKTTRKVKKKTVTKKKTTKKKKKATKKTKKKTTKKR